jgi:hypothetical protein
MAPGMSIGLGLTCHRFGKARLIFQKANARHGAADFPGDTAASAISLDTPIQRGGADSGNLSFMADRSGAFHHARSLATRSSTEPKTAAPAAVRRRVFELNVPVSPWTRAPA